MVRSATQWNCRFRHCLAQLKLSKFEGSLARKLRFHIFHFHFLREISHESFVFISSTVRSDFDDFDGSLSRKLRFHIFNCPNLTEVSHESFVFTSSTVGIWRKSLTRASFSHLPLSDFEGGLARKLCFHIFNFQILREVSHESFVFTSSTVGIWRKSRTKASFSHLSAFSYLPLSDFEGRLARKLRFHIFHFHPLREVSHEMRF